MMQLLIDSALTGDCTGVPESFAELVEQSDENRRKRIVSVLLKYGWHGTDALKVMLDESEKQEKYNDYVGVVQRCILSILANQAGQDIDIPGYVEFMYPEEVRHESAEEIINRILSELQK